MKDFLKNFFDIKFWKFILVGVINTIVGMGVMYALYNLANLKELDSGTVKDLGYWLSTAANYIVGSILSYFLNKNFTFKSKESSKNTIWKFIINIAVCWGLAYGIAKPLTLRILMNTSISMDLQKNIAMLVGSCLFVGFNYIGQRFFAFRENKPTAEKV